MAYNPDAIRRIREQVLWNFTRGNILPPGFVQQQEEDTTPEKLAALKRSVKGEPAPQPPPEPRKMSLGQRLTQAINWSFAGGEQRRALGDFRTPIMLEHVTLTVQYNAAAPATLVGIGLYYYPTAGATPTAPVIYSDPSTTQIAINPYYPGSYVAQLDNSSLNLQLLELPLMQVIPHTESTVAMHCLFSAAAACDIGAIIHYREISEMPEIITSYTPTATLRRSMSVAPLPPPKGPAIPRGVTITVLQGGRAIYSRQVAWPSLDTELKKEFLNYQLSGNYPPTMQPIW